MFTVVVTCDFKKFSKVKILPTMKEVYDVLISKEKMRILLEDLGVRLNAQLFVGEIRIGTLVRM